MYKNNRLNIFIAMDWSPQSTPILIPNFTNNYKKPMKPMKPIFKFIILLLFVSSCSKKKDTQHKQTEKFTSELLELKEYFQIPGLAVSIEKDGSTIYQNYLGVSNLENEIKLDSTVLFPMHQ